MLRARDDTCVISGSLLLCATPNLMRYNAPDSDLRGIYTGKLSRPYQCTCETGLEKHLRLSPQVFLDYDFSWFLTKVERLQHAFSRTLTRLQHAFHHHVQKEPHFLQYLIPLLVIIIILGIILTSGSIICQGSINMLHFP